MHCDAEAGAPARAAGGERDEDGAAAAPARLRGDLRFRARVVGAAGVALCVSLCVLAAAGPDGWGQPGELEQAANALMKRLNYLNDYSTKTTDVDKELESYRIERDVALAAMGHTSLTAIPTATPQEQRERLLKLREHAIAKLHRINRGRRSWSYGLKTGDLAMGAQGDCDEGDAKLGLCGVTVPSPSAADLTAEEAKVAKELMAKEQASDAARAKVVAAIDHKRLVKAQKLMDRLSKTDGLINEMVHHTIKVSQMPAHAPDTRD